MPVILAPSRLGQVQGQEHYKVEASLGHFSALLQTRFSPQVSLASFVSYLLILMGQLSLYLPDCALICPFPKSALLQAQQMAVDVSQSSFYLF